MTSLPPSPVKKFPENSVEKQVYNLIESYAQYIPITNDRNRMSFCLVKYLLGEGDKPEILVRTQKIRLEGISQAELAKKLNTDLAEIKK